MLFYQISSCKCTKYAVVLYCRAGQKYEATKGLLWTIQTLVFILFVFQSWLSRNNFTHNRQFCSSQQTVQWFCVCCFLLSHTFYNAQMRPWNVICKLKSKNFNPLTLINNSPHTLPWSSCDVSLENLVLDQPIIPN